MPELTTDFQSLPEEYQHIIRLAQDTYNITVAPLQLLVGGWSGAVVYLVSVSSNETRRVEHCILKLDRKGKNAKSDEVIRHNAVMSKATPAFAREHIAELVFDKIEYESAHRNLLSYRGSIPAQVFTPVQVRTTKPAQNLVYPNKYSPSG